MYSVLCPQNNLFSVPPKIFECMCLVHNNDPHKTKLDSCALFLGILGHKKGISVIVLQWIISLSNQAKRDFSHDSFSNSVCPHVRLHLRLKRKREQRQPPPTPSPFAQAGTALLSALTLSFWPPSSSPFISLTSNLLLPPPPSSSTSTPPALDFHTVVRFTSFS